MRGVVLILNAMVYHSAQRLLFRPVTSTVDGRRRESCPSEIGTWCEYVDSVIRRSAQIATQWPVGSALRANWRLSRTAVQADQESDTRISPMGA